MTVDQAVKKFKLEPLNVYTAKAKAKELNVDEVLYMNVQKNKYAYVVKDGARGYNNSDTVFCAIFRRRNGKSAAQY